MQVDLRQQREKAKGAKRSGPKERGNGKRRKAWGGQDSLQDSLRDQKKKHSLGPALLLISPC